VNRVGDMFLSVGFFAIFWVFGNVDYATVFSVAPFINESAITIIGLLLLVGAMAKSAQIGLHTWLPDAMEGWALTFILVYTTVISMIFVLFIDTIGTMDHYQLALPPLMASIPIKELEVMTGNMLGDGSIRYPNLRRDGEARGNARYEMTMSAKAQGYMESLFNGTYAQYSTSKGLLPYPNTALPQHIGKDVTQYYFSTRMLPIFTALHSVWYRKEGDSFVKVVPHIINDMFSPISLAYWIMEDGYFDSYGRAKTILLCTECFTVVECELLQQVLLNMGITSTLKVRNSTKGTYRIRISKASMPLLRNLVAPHMHTDFMYKLGV
jgi:succinate dehydrogenase hydrophobic anchor subunit